MSKLRIAMLTTFFPPYSFGGDAVAIARQAAALAARGHDVTVIHDIDAYLSLAKSEPASAPAIEGVNVIGLRSGLGILSNFLTHQLGKPIVHDKQLKSILAPGAFDIIWYHNISLVGGPGILSYGDGLKIYEAHEHWLVCPTHVLWRHNREVCDGRECLRCVLSYKRPPQLWRYAKTLEGQLQHVDAFIAKSEFSRGKHREFGFPRDMTVVPYFLPDIGSGADEAKTSPHDRPYFLFVGRLEKIKGLDDVIPVFAEYPDADLLIIGDGEYEQELRAKAAGIPSVKFLGRMPFDEIRKYYQCAISLIVPSVCFETFGIILIESFNLGTPVIARDIGPFREIVERCGGGMLYSDNNELMNAMKHLQSDVSRRASMAASARTGYERYWSEKAVMNDYFTLIGDIAKATGNDHIAAIAEVETRQ